MRILQTILFLLQRIAFTAVLGGVLVSSAGGQGQNAPQTWTGRDTGLANQYLSLLVSQPEYGRVLDLLWALYEKHDATALLIENVTVQIQANRHPSVLMVLGHLHRKDGNLAKAATLYDEVIQADPQNANALQSRAAVAQEMGDPVKAWQLIGQLSGQ